MLYNLSTELDQARAKEKLAFFIREKQLIDIQVVTKKRSYSQNRYLHLILSWFGREFGYTMEEVKQEIFKKIVNYDIFYNGETTGQFSFSRWRSTADLNTSEMTFAIDNFRDFAAQHGCYLPEPKDLVLLQQMETALRSKNY